MKAAGRSVPARGKRIAVSVVILVGIAVAVAVLMVRARYVWSEDATLDAEVVHIASTVGGRVTHIAVRENDLVERGDLLFQIDPEPLQLAVNQATADLALARATQASQQRVVGTEHSSVVQAAEQTHRARVNLALAQRTVERLRPLAAKGHVPQQQLDQAQTVERDAQTTLRQAQEHERAATSAVGNDDSGQATVQAREAALALARHALESATVRAPHAGRIVGLTTASGEVVVPSQSLFALVRSDDWSAVTNLRESDLARVQVGQCATVYSMIDRRQALRGKVQGIGAGVLDTEHINLPRSLPYVPKSMNWVRVAQRFPVRIQLDESPASLMRLGASAVVEIGHGAACR